MKWFKSKKKEAEEAQEQRSGIDMRTKYKCRYCGEIFDTHDRDRRHGLWEGSIFKEVLTYEEQGHPIRYAIHFAEDYAENPHLGFADLLGFEVIYPEREEK